jgi:hypothetical protein
MEHNQKLILATIVSESERLNFPPRHFGRLMLEVEQRTYSWLSRLCEEYAGGFWNMVTLDNDGAYLAPTSADHFRIAVHSNGFAGTMSADATGVTVTLFALSSLAFDYPKVEVLSTRFHQLREFALQHAERRPIFQAID